MGVGTAHAYEQYSEARHNGELDADTDIGQPNHKFAPRSDGLTARETSRCVW